VPRFIAAALGLTTQREMQEEDNPTTEVLLLLTLYTHRPLKNKIKKNLWRGRRIFFPPIADRILSFREMGVAQPSTAWRSLFE